MKINLTRMIQHRHTTKICSIILGYSIWFCIAQHQTISQSYEALICFYDAQTEQIAAPASVEITLQGNRKELYKFKKEHATIHLDGANLKDGVQEILLSRENLFLPDTLKLVDLVPTHISIHVDNDKKL
jgi:hypothetical protein